MLGYYPECHEIVFSMNVFSAEDEPSYEESADKSDSDDPESCVLVNDCLSNHVTREDREQEVIGESDEVQIGQDNEASVSLFVLLVLELECVAVHSQLRVAEISSG